jgi:bacterioferritin
MVKVDIKAEQSTIDLYKDVIQLAEKEGDVTTAHIFRDILEQEEEHLDTFTTVFEEICPPI